MNPNSPTEVPPNVMLPFNQNSLAELMVSTPQVMAGIFMQYYQGVDNHPLQVQAYRLDEALYVDWDWNDYYDGPMINLRKMIDFASGSGAAHYEGIGKILMALCLGNVSSVWGDVPYSAALQGAVDQSPVYDPQQVVYESIQQLLDEGIIHMEADYEGLKPGSDDLIFGGNAAKWITTAYALKARYYMHLSKLRGQLDFDPLEEALENALMGFASSGDDLVYEFGYSASEYSPFYSFTRLNYIIPHPTFTGLMSALGDPRRDFLFKKKFGVATLNGNFFTSPGSPAHMMTYHELKFIEAEARLRLDEDDPVLEETFREAIRSSLVKICGQAVDSSVINAYVDANGVLQGSFDEKLSRLILQKYLAMFSSIESWTDYRRTGYPDLVPNDGGDHNQNPGGAIPRRFAYPQTERLYNENFPELLPTLQDRFWWDTE